MTNYTVTRWVSPIKRSVDAALAVLETQMETVENSKTIYISEVLQMGSGYVAILLYAT